MLTFPLSTKKKLKNNYDYFWHGFRNSQSYVKKWEKRQVSLRAKLGMFKKTTKDIKIGSVLSHKVKSVKKASVQNPANLTNLGNKFKLKKIIRKFEIFQIPWINEFQQISIRR